MASRPRSACVNPLSAAEACSGLRASVAALRQRVPVVRPLAERDAEPRAAELAEVVDHRARVLHGAAQVAGALRPLAARAAEVALELLLRARDALRVGAQVEAEVDGPHDGLRI